MSGSLPCELNKFGNHAKRLREIMDETKKNFDEINNYGKLDGAQVVSAEFLQEEVAEVMSTVEKPPCLLVLGQNAYVKARLVNEIFNRLIFPVLDPDEGRDISFRMVTFKHGHSPSVSLTLPDDYDLVESLEAYNGPWQCIPRGDLELTESEKLDPAKGTAILEVSLNHPFLRSGARVKVSPCNHGGNIEQIMQKCIADVSPIILYGFNTDQLTTEDLAELTELKRLTHLHPVLFVRVINTDPNSSDSENIDSRSSRNKRRNSGKGPLSNFVNNYSLANSKRKELSKSLSPRLRGVLSPERTLRHSVRSSLTVFHQLCDLGFLTLLPGDVTISKLTGDYFEMDSEFVEEFENFQTGLLLFVRKALKRYLINAATVLNNSHNRCLQMFILSAYDMARDMMITPKKLEFAREKEDGLYKSLLELTVSKHEEIKEIITQSVEVMKNVLIEKAALYDFIGVTLPESGEVQTAKVLQHCTGQIQDLVLSQLNQAIAGKLVSSINILHDTYTGTLTRCLESLEKPENGEKGDSLPATDSLKQILNAAYQIEITSNSSSSLMRTLFEKMKQLINSMPWKTSPKVDTEWKKKVASDMINSLNAARLAKSLSSQMKDRLNKSHESFTSALRQLESRHSGRLDKIEDERLRVRKVHAPKVAKLALESTSLKDVILHGMPQMGREIGRGQYGVVYACESWAGHSPSAIKSVVPPDDKHWNDLALEFYYTKNVPEHPRIAALRGSVIDYMYGGGTSPAVLLIMDRLQKDLYGAIKQGLDWINRLQVAIDVVDGLRFLHSQGLVHRDIKLKNVLLDKHNRGKITDLGFCKPEAMMSGSIVGTPIHMAPELFTGKYLNWVDVYAFGILFWYICAGHVRLPSSFEQCANKDQLWQSVKKGLRPEKLQQFDDECWQMMQACWEGEPYKRPLLGDVESELYTILERFQKRLSTSPPQQKTKEVKLIAKSSHKITN